jgi:hypothetical protein
MTAVLRRARPDDYEAIAFFDHRALSHAVILDFWSLFDQKSKIIA